MTGLATVLGLSVLILGAGGQERHRLDGAKFGAKSSYFPVANTDDSPLEVPGCTPALLWMYVRHGTRNPGDSDIAGMKTHSRRCIITEQAPTRACSFATFANTTPDPDPSNLASRKNLIK